MNKIQYAMIYRNTGFCEFTEVDSVDAAEEAVRDLLDGNNIGLIQSGKDIIHYQLTVHRYQEYAGASFQRAYAEQMHVIRNETIADFIKKYKKELAEIHRAEWEAQRRADRNSDYDNDSEW